MRTMVCFSSLSWDFLWLRHQELMSRFADAGHRVLFVEPIGIRMPKWEDRGRVVSRLRNRRRTGARGLRVVRPNVWALDPLVNPFQQFGPVHRRNVAALTRQIEQGLAELGGGPPLIYTFVPTPLARDVIARLPHVLVAFDCMDALTENPKGVFASYADSERALSREADVVFVTSPALWERQSALNPRTYYVPHGVQYERFAADAGAAPASVAALPHPRLCFFGGLDERVDLELLDRLVMENPSWQLILLGVVRTDAAALTRRPNVHFLGHIAHTDLPAYLHHMDVLLLPYRQTAFTHYINPAKLYECLAVGKPVVATFLPVFDRLRDVLRVADRPDDFGPLVAATLSEGDDPGAVAARRARARDNTWEARWAELNAHLVAVGGGQWP